MVWGTAPPTTYLIAEGLLIDPLVEGEQRSREKNIAKKPGKPLKREQNPAEIGNMAQYGSCIVEKKHLLRGGSFDKTGG